MPTGGEYTLEVRAIDRGGALATALCPGILVGDLWVMGGQSNMQGRGRLDAPEVEEPHTLVHAFDMSDRWLIAREPLHWRLDSPDPAHWPELRQPTDDERLAQHKGRTDGVGPGLAFAGEVVRQAGVPIGLVPCAVGGTSMEQWDPEQVKLGGRSLYGAMLRRVDAVGGRVRGLLWYQGEADAVGCVSNVFAARFSRFVQAVRHDFGSPDLPVLFVQIARRIVPDDVRLELNAVQEAQRICAREVPNTDFVPSVDLPHGGLRPPLQRRAEAARRAAGRGGAAPLLRLEQPAARAEAGVRGQSPWTARCACATARSTPGCCPRARSAASPSATTRAPT